MLNIAANGSSGYNLTNSLRFRSSASAYLSRTPSTPTNNKIWTYSFWVKRGIISTGPEFLISSLSDLNNYDRFWFTGSDVLEFDSFIASATSISLVTTQVFRDSSAWYHIVLAVDTTQATAANRVKLYINGNQITSFTTATYPAQNANTWIDSANIHNIGRFTTGNYYYDGYQTETNFIDGQALTPSSFGSTDATTGVWKPAKYTGTYGINGFYLPFTDNTGTSQNFILSSEDFSNATYWDKLSYPVTVTANSVTAPNGTTTADTLLGANGVLSLIFQSVATSITGTGALTASIYAKAGTGTEFTLNAYYSSDTEVNTTFNVSTGAVTSGSGTITSVGSGWYRCSIQIPARTGAGTSVLFRIWTNPRGDATNRSIYAWGAQINTGSTVSPYYPTTTAAQTSINNLGVDYSVATGGYNNWIPNNISVTAGTTYDSITDVPTLTSATVANYCTLNPLPYYGYNVLSQGNLRFTPMNSNWMRSFGTISVSSGKWYWEVTGNSSLEQMHGILLDTAVQYYAGATNWVGFASDGYGYYTAGTKWTSNSGVSYGASYTAGDVIGVALNLDAGTLIFYKNNVSQGTAFTGLSGNFVPAVSVTTNGGANSCDVNFGQQGFKYTPPSGYVALNTYNLPDSTIKQGNKYMDAVTYTGDGTNYRVISNINFSPDMVWSKTRSVSANHVLLDRLRGSFNLIYPNLTNAEGYGNSIIFDSGNTYEVMSDFCNTNTYTYVNWIWKANGSGVSNTNGSITSTVSANTTAGFSVVTYTGTGANATVGHGLGVAPKVVLVKKRSAASSWVMYHGSLAATQRMILETTAAVATDASVWNSTAPTSSVFSLGNDAGVNGSAATFVAYCWAEIAGFSKFGSYTGNGSTDGTFVYTGFKPKFILIKETSAADNWVIWDTTRNPYNSNDAQLSPNVSTAEGNAAITGNPIDILSNGFKQRTTGARTNGSGATYIYAAFAENPFKNSNAF